MSFYLLDHPPRRPQFRRPRRETLSGLVVVHTVEAPPTVWDCVRAAQFIRDRTKAGSYHEVCQRGDYLRLCPDDVEAFHVAANGLNRPSWGISAVCRTTDWGDNEFTRRTLATMAVRIVEFWRRNGFDPSRARWATPVEAHARIRGPLLTTHGDVQPSDRSDAWTRHPMRRFLDGLLLDLIHADSAPAPSPQEDDDMYTHIKVRPGTRNSPTNEWLVTPGGVKFAATTPGLVDGLRRAGVIRATVDLSGDAAASVNFVQNHP